LKINSVVTYQLSTVSTEQDKACNGNDALNQFESTIFMKKSSKGKKQKPAPISPHL